MDLSDRHFGTARLTAIWIGLDGDDLISTHMRYNAKLRNMRRDPRVVLSFAPPQRPGDRMSPHAIIHATAAIAPLGLTAATTRQGLRRARSRIPGSVSDRIHRAVLHPPDRRRGPLGRGCWLTVALR